MAGPEFADFGQDGGPAFPFVRQTPMGTFTYAGLSTRDYFAAAALQGMPMMTWTNGPPDSEYTADIARSAYAYADAMLAARLTPDQERR